MSLDLCKLSVLIPAYKPGKELIELSQELLDLGFKQVLVVDDGSGREYEHIFNSLITVGCKVLRHAINMGKGRALKTGINELIVQSDGVCGVITADADGQHLPQDIVKVGRTLLEFENAIILGSRTFSGKVPLKSRFGNTITKNVFNLISGLKIRDTQTGLRGLPFNSLEKLLTLTGERYEYEMNMLLEASNLNLSIKEVDIETVYINKNEGSHFNPLKDSWRIYRLIILFASSSFVAFLIDFLIYSLITLIFPQETMLWLAVVGARVVSSTLNFSINRNIIFSKKGGRLKNHLLAYYLLAAVIMIANYCMIYGLVTIGFNRFVAKIIVEVILFFFSYTVQKRFIFK